MFKVSLSNERNCGWRSGADVAFESLDKALYFVLRDFEYNMEMSIMDLLAKLLVSFESQETIAVFDDEETNTRAAAMTEAAAQFLEARDNAINNMRANNG